MRLPTKVKTRLLHEHRHSARGLASKGSVVGQRGAAVRKAGLNTTFGTTIRISRLHQPSCMSWRPGDLRFLRTIGDRWRPPMPLLDRCGTDPARTNGCGPARSLTPSALRSSASRTRGGRPAWHGRSRPRPSDSLLPKPDRAGLVPGEAANGAGHGCHYAIRECPLGTGCVCCEWHAGGTGGENERGSDLAATAPSSRVGKARSRWPQTRWQALRRRRAPALQSFAVVGEWGGVMLPA
jgi:hypothetical protein